MTLNFEQHCSEKIPEEEECDSSSMKMAYSDEASSQIDVNNINNQNNRLCNEDDPNFANISGNRAVSTIIPSGGHLKIQITINTRGESTVTIKEPVQEPRNSSLILPTISIQNSRLPDTNKRFVFCTSPNRNHLDPSPWSPLPRSPQNWSEVKYISAKQMSASDQTTENGNARTAVPTGFRTMSSSSSSTEPTNDQVTEYLRSHPDFLERFIMEEVEPEQLERWIIRRSQRAKKKLEANNANALAHPNQSTVTNKNIRKTSLSRWKFCVHADKRQMLLDLTQSLQLRPTKDHVLWELASCISSAVGADGFRLFLAERGNPETLALYLGEEIREQNGEPKLQKLDSGITVPGYVARTREPVRLSKAMNDPRFPNGILHSEDVNHVLCQAVVQPDGQLVAVLELWRRDQNQPFYEEDEEIGCSYLVWGGIALHYAHLYLNMDKQRKLNDFLLAVVKSIFQDMVSMDTLVVKIMNFAQRLVDADRASLFLVDSKNRELYATIFDVGVERSQLRTPSTNSVPNSSGDEDTNGQTKNNRPKEIRFPLGTGIAGQVALTGEILNIDDAYSDLRFNRNIDQLTGYKTDTILCMPIFIRGQVIGVVQMINKHVGTFTKEDEEAFEMFGVYCGLALHHAKLYDKIRRSEQKYRVALEVLSYHNTCSEEELRLALDQGIPKDIVGVDDYYFSPFDLDDYEKARYAIFMFTDLFGLQRFDESNLIRFILTVKKNYRRVPYHNWTHGFSVAHSMYSIIKHARHCFRPNESLALFIGALCHDLDHRGKNNKFMLDTESPLAAIYSTSTMEHHHFNQTVTILQQEGHNIFSKLSSHEYKQVLSLVKHCILATDLALFFPCKARLSKLVQEDVFSFSNFEHRTLLLAISMTSSDLSASAKPWDIQAKTVEVIFEEFYQQGDEERAAGRQPISMMDRSQPDQQASSQVGFLNGICLPCYQLLHRLIPETKPLLDMCQKNLHRWQKIDEHVKKALQEDDDARRTENGD